MPRHGPGGFMMIYIVEGGPGRGKDWRPRSWAHTHGDPHIWGVPCGAKRSFGQITHLVGIVTYSRTTVQSYSSCAHSSPHTVFLKYDFMISAEYWFYWCILLPIYIIMFTWFISLQMQFLRHTSVLWFCIDSYLYSPHFSLSFRYIIHSLGL